MSLVSGIRGFSVSMYGQSGLVMDWFGLNDPFTQQVPLKITNAYSGTLWFQSQLVNPRSGYYNYSGIQLGSVNSGASATLVATWDAGVSGWITGSSPITDTLTLNLTTFTSSNYTGSYSSGNFTVPNTLFNRYSGVIKVFGDIYSNDQPTPSTSKATGGTLNQSGTYSYAVSYNLSGWESDISSPSTALTLTSGYGTISVSWSTITGVSQYFLWRWSGSIDYTLYSGILAGFGTLRPIDLIAVQTTTGFTDNGVAAIQANLFRHRDWQNLGNITTTSVTTYLSAPQSRQSNGAGFHAHGFQLNKNLSGTNLLGPFYGVVHLNPNNRTNQIALALQTGVDGATSGTTIADTTIFSGLAINNWYRFCIQLGASGLISNSGDVHIQVQTGQVPAATVFFDDVFVIAQS